jgi:addiction module HigA family antidote
MDHTKIWPAFHPGEMLREDYLPDLGWTPRELADHLRIPVEHVQELLAERVPVTSELALRLGRLFDQTPAYWMNLQQAYDLYQAQRSPAARDILEIEPLRKAG